MTEQCNPEYQLSDKSRAELSYSQNLLVQLSLSFDQEAKALGLCRLF